MSDAHRQKAFDNSDQSLCIITAGRSCDEGRDNVAFAREMFSDCARMSNLPPTPSHSTSGINGAPYGSSSTAQLPVRGQTMQLQDTCERIVQLSMTMPSDMSNGNIDTSKAFQQRLQDLADSIAFLWRNNGGSIVETLCTAISLRPHQSRSYAQLLSRIVAAFSESSEVSSALFEALQSHLRGALEKNAWSQVRALAGFLPHVGADARQFAQDFVAGLLEKGRDPTISSNQIMEMIQTALYLGLLQPELVTRQHLRVMDHLAESDHYKSALYYTRPWTVGSKGTPSAIMDLNSFALSTLQSTSAEGTEDVNQTVRERGGFLMAMEIANCNQTIPRMNWTFRFSERPDIDQSLPDQSTTILARYIMADMVHLYRENRLQLRDELLEYRSFPFQVLSQITQIESLLVDTICTAVCQPATESEDLLYYNALTTALCRKHPQTMAPCIGRAIRATFDMIGQGFDWQCTENFSTFFAVHLSNFGLQWPWSIWKDDMARPKLHPKRMFAERSIQQLVKLSYFDRIQSTMADDLVPGFVLTTPSINAVLTDVSSTCYAQAQDLQKALQERKTAEEIIVMQAGLAQDISGITDEKEGLLQRLTIECLLLQGGKSFSHLLNVIERYLKLWQHIAATENGRHNIFDVVMEVFSTEHSMRGIILEKLLQYRVIDPYDVAEWLSEAKQKCCLSSRWMLYRLALRKNLGRLAQIRQRLAQFRQDRDISTDKGNPAQGDTGVDAQNTLMAEKIIADERADILRFAGDWYASQIQELEPRLGKTKIDFFDDSLVSDDIYLAWTIINQWQSLARNYPEIQYGPMERYGLSFVDTSYFDLLL